MKLVKLLVVVGLVVAGVIVWQKYGKSAATPDQAQTAVQKQEPRPGAEQDRPGVEEKYGFTTQQVNP